MAKTNEPKSETTDAISQETLSQAIVKISEGMERLNASGLNKKAILVLLADATGLSRRVCGQVVDGMHSLARTYTR